MSQSPKPKLKASHSDNQNFRCLFMLSLVYSLFSRFEKESYKISLLASKIRNELEPENDA